ncbi:hypothetical protein [Methylorubrum thiocyanatum]|uniref:hypothetical protein n=1 Tax=Methylorubrum thiocyanatum TaxID=47958 RepID=UPI003668D073
MSQNEKFDLINALREFVSLGEAYSKSDGVFSSVSLNPGGLRLSVKHPSDTNYESATSIPWETFENPEKLRQIAQRMYAEQVKAALENVGKTFP